MSPLTLACHAMATRFEFLIYSDDPRASRAAAEEAIQVIERLEARLSLFRASSEISHLNARAAREPVQVTPGLFSLLEHAQRLCQESDGAFDVTVAPLMRCWGFMGGNGRLADPDKLAEARANVGMHLVQLEPKSRTVRFAREGVMIDLGAIGKGLAIEQAVEVLRDAGIESALVHGGTSTAYALGHPPDAESWTVAVKNPLPADDSAPRPPLAKVPLVDHSLSVSDIRGKCFEVEGKILGHVLDPRTGEPASKAVLAAVALPSPTETDALSTALLTLGPEGHDSVAALRPGIRTLVAWQDGSELRCQSQGIDVCMAPVPGTMFTGPG